MLNVLYAELLKLKHTKIPWLILVGALPANLISLFVFLPRVAPEGTELGIDLLDMFYRQGMMLVMMGPSIFALLTAYIITREYQDRTINQLFSYPISRVRILAAKLSVVFGLIALTTMLSCVTVLAAGTFLLFNNQIEMDSIWMGVRMNMMICALSFGTIPFTAFVSLIGKNVMAPAVVGVMATIVTVIGEVGHGRGGILFPWLTPYWPVRELAQGISDNTGPNPYALPAMVILSLTFFLPLLFCIYYYIRADVHSGS